MGVTSVPGRVARARGDRAGASAQLLAPADAAWIAAALCALLTLAAILVLAEPIGSVLFAPKRYDFFAEIAGDVYHEPTEHTSYLLALGATAALAGAIAAVGLRPAAAPRVPARQLLVRGSQALLLAFLITGLVAQHVITYGPLYTLGAPAKHVYFTWPTVAVAVAFAALAAWALHAPAARDRLAALLRETPGRRIAAIAIAVLFTAAWLLTAINVDSSVANTNRAVFDMLPWSLDETFAIVDGRTPLVNFHAQYGELWPYVAAASLGIFGTTLAVWTATMAAIGGIALLAVLGVLRRVTRSSLAALALFAPFVATGFFMERGPLANRYGPSNLYTIFPVRYAGPYLLAWLLARHLSGERPRRVWPLFLAGGLVVLNNPEFGAPAFGATLLACVAARPPRSWRKGGELLAQAAAGALGAVVLVSALTLAHSGSLPRFSLLFEFSKLYGLSGFAMLPMPHLGFHLVVFATFVAAIALAAVRASSGERDTLLTGMLAWTGVFGLGAGTYFVGRSHPDVLVDVFSIWALALALLTVVAVRAIAARPSRRPTAVELAVFVGLGLAVCSIAQTPAPWSQLNRLGTTTAEPAFWHNASERFIGAHTRRGEHVVILNPAGHRYAHDVGVVNVSPYASSESIVTVHQLATTVRALRAARGRKLFFSLGDTGRDQMGFLQQDGFAFTHVDKASNTVEAIDRSGG
jgi:hypothetical protein